MLCYTQFYGRKRAGESNYHDSQEKKFWSKITLYRLYWKNYFPSPFGSRHFDFRLSPFRHFPLRATRRHLASRCHGVLPAGDVPLDLADFSHVVALAPLQQKWFLHWYFKFGVFTFWNLSPKIKCWVASENNRSNVKTSEVAALSKSPSTVIWSASSKICCYVIVTQQRPIVQQFAPEFRNLPLQAKKRIQWTAKLITACYQNSEPESCAVWVSYCHCKN